MAYTIQEMADVDIEVFSTYFMTKLRKDGLKAVEKWYRKVSAH